LAVVAYTPDRTAAADPAITITFLNIAISFFIPEPDKNQLADQAPASLVNTILLAERYFYLLTQAEN
jgi:hypothetical protein